MPRCVPVPSRHGALSLLLLLAACAAPQVDLESLLAEMVDPATLARLPAPAYQQLQASSYNRASTRRDAPGWFADSDGEGFVREEVLAGRREWVLMEADGPGCITRIWTPYFYRDLGERTGPHVRVYLDGAATPVVDEPLTRLVRGEGSIAAPFAMPTARAGDLYLPIPYARSCKVTMTGRPFYFVINHRAYAPGTAVATWTPAAMAAAQPALARAADALTAAAPAPTLRRVQVAPGAAVTLQQATGPGAFRTLSVRLPAAVADPALLRSTVLTARFDGTETVWCPVGDFFCCADAVHPFRTRHREVGADGCMTARWIMPFAARGEVAVRNLGVAPLDLEFDVVVGPWDWDARSLWFHARWRPDEVVPGTPFRDWNFVTVAGAGVFVGDAWTVLNPQPNTWWGEGDEKIYVDDAWDQGFPTHFGTGTEDYYGWAGGEIPTRRDEFSHPFLANVRVGGLDGTTQGFNINTRERGLDAIPFRTGLRFDMESSFGTDIRGAQDHLGYSAVVFYYARPGAQDNRPPQPEAAQRPVPRLDRSGPRPRIVH